MVKKGCGTNDPLRIRRFFDIHSHIWRDPGPDVRPSKVFPTVGMVKIESQRGFGF